MNLPNHLQRIFPDLLGGLTARRIAQRTGLTLRTVQAYTQDIYAIYNVHSREELVKEFECSFT